MDAVTYRLDQFEGPLDLLLTLIQKNKVNITDIPISLICDQYVEYIAEAQKLDMEVASEFIVMASELMLIKSRMLLPRDEEDEEDPRATLTDALLRYQQAKEAVAKLTPLYAYYGGRMVKDTDEISVDKTFVADQEVTDLCAAIRRIIAYNNALEKAATTAFKPMISKPIIPVEIKIVSIIKTLETRGVATLDDLIMNEASLPDLIASFLGVLELVKIRKLLIADMDGETTDNALLSTSTRFILNTDDTTVEPNEYGFGEEQHDDGGEAEQISMFEE
ncbi:MAG: segregation/condensation protein A [Clostridia bacterium]|nr:segregation/condensation protein A [Clostridia bacterium]